MSNKVNVKKMRAARRRRKWIKRNKLLIYIIIVPVSIILCVLAGLGIKKCSDLILLNNKPTKSNNKNNSKINTVERPKLDVELLTVNEYSRPGTKLEEINGIVIHYTANPGSTARQNRDYFEGLKDVKSTKASSHFIIGLDGEIVQCIPSSEISYASNDRNVDTISIECCHADESGKFNKATYKSLVHLTAWLCLEFDVEPDNVIRHYDVTGKNCPKYYVENKSEWNKFIKDVKNYIKKNSR